MDANIKDYQFNKLSLGVLNFVTNQLSAMYYMSIKDRLYCDAETDQSRQSAQYVLYQILFTLLKCIAPIVPHLAEELYSHLPQKQTTSFFQVDYKINDEWDNAEVDEIMAVLMSIKKEINKSLGSSTLDQLVEVRLSKKLMHLLKVQFEANSI